MNTLLAIAGNPNSGKTTLFNRLTGLRQKVGNYAGVTVEKKTGSTLIDDTSIDLIDLPGTYALTPRSEEEKVAADIITGQNNEVSPIDGVLCVIDSTSLERSLYLALQIKEAGIPMALLLNMADELQLRGAQIDVHQLEIQLGIPVLLISATKDEDLLLVQALLKNWPKRSAFLKIHSEAVAYTTQDIGRRRFQAKQLYRAVMKKELAPHPWSDKIDDIVLHPLWGSLIFAAVVLLVFQAIFTGAQPLMNGIDQLFGALGEFAKTHISQPIFASLVSDGIIAGVGSVVVFLPQILIVFFFIAILEHSGYMARAAMVMDRVMNKVGLQGKSFLPLISSYACAVPGIMATRTIENKRDRLATILIAPFMTCSARLPVYALLISAFIPSERRVGHLISLRALTLLALYALGFLAAVFTAWILKSSILKADRTPFFMEIPPYRWPTTRTILLLMWDRSRIFLRRAGTLILGITIILWFLVSFPRHEGPDAIRQSYAGQIGVAIEPIIKPLGFNWKIGVGLLSAQVAREVIVSSLSTIYRIDSKDTTTQSLQKALHQDMTPLSAISLMVFFAFAMQCTSTLAVVRRETASWLIPLAMFIYMNAYAYLASLLVYQGGKLLGFR